MIGNAIIEVDMADRFCPLFRVRYSVAGAPVTWAAQCIIGHGMTRRSNG
jgi:hypothetical protein